MRLGIALALASSVASAAPPAPAPAPAIELALARTLLPGGDDCGDVECLIARAYRSDAKARQLALALWTDFGDLAGVGADEIMDGGYRGRIHLVKRRSEPQKASAPRRPG